MANVDIDALLNLMENINLAESGISFQGQKLKLDEAKDWDRVVQAIDQCERLDFLNLEGNTLGVEASKAIAKALESKPELKRALWKDIFTGRMKEEIPKALLHLGSGLTLAGARLTELDMSDNAFGPIGVEGLAGLLSSPTCYQLQQLKLNNNGLGQSGGKMLSQALLQCYNNSIKEGKPLALKVFIAGRNRLENEGAEALSKVFKALGTLEEIVMPQNGIYPPGIKALSAAFVNNPNLTIINLNDNTVTEAGATDIAKALSHLQNLKILNLGDCLLKTRGAEVIAKALAEKHGDMEELYLCFNEIKSSGGMAVARAMKNKSKLKHLSLNGNNFGEEGCNSLKNVMLADNTISSLGSLSDDDGEDEDENDADDRDSKQEDDYGSESDKSLEKNVGNMNFNTPLKQNKESNLTQSSMKNLSLEEYNFKSISNFLTNPTLDNFKEIDKKLIVNYVDMMQNSSQEFYLETLIPLIVKVSSLSCCSSEDFRSLSSDVANDLYSNLFSWAGEQNQISAVNNSLVVYLGLIKSEDKKFKINWDIKGSLSALKTAIDKGIAPESTEQILNCCLNKEQKI